MDWEDPLTGLAASGRCGPSIWSEADGVEQLLAGNLVHTEIASDGSRMIVAAPRFGSSVFPATAFIAGNTNAVLDVLSRF